MTLDIGGFDISHSRLVDLAKLADQSRPFYDWVENKFRAALNSNETLDVLLRTATREQLAAAIASCYVAVAESNVPLLPDGIGRTYPHAKACYYFFAWMIRDAPQQRLGPLITRIAQASKQGRIQTEIKVLAILIYNYRKNVKTFSWEAIREVILDRLEGSRRSIKGHEKEAIGRTALITAFQSYYKRHGNYGSFAKVEIPDSQVTVKNETFDVSANLLDGNGQRKCRILVPIKTRETEGGGHAHLFSRDVKQALNAVRSDNQVDFLSVVIVARNWSAREADEIRNMVDHAAVFDLSPNEFVEFGETEQKRLNDFIAAVLDGKLKPKQSA